VATGEQGVSSPGLSPDIPGILKDMFARLEAERNHGRMLVSRALGYLAASRHGLTEDELLDLLSADTEVMGVSGRELPISKTARGVESSSEALKR
jgi:ketosteroid isomerase-like protein